jgi:exosortase/archaeosortase family protein
VIFAFPSPWRERFRGAGLGLLLIAGMNTVRIGHLSLVAGNPALLAWLHVYIWPALLAGGVLVYVFFWMRRTTRTAAGGGGGGAGSASVAGVSGSGVGFGSSQLSSSWSPSSSRSGSAGSSGGSVAVGRLGGGRVAGGDRRIDGSCPPRISPPQGRFLVTAMVLTAGYFALAPWLFAGRAVAAAETWVAATGAALMGAFGATVTVSGNILQTSRGPFVVTPECILTPTSRAAP